MEFHIKLIPCYTRQFNLQLETQQTLHCKLPKLKIARLTRNSRKPQQTVALRVTRKVELFSTLLYFTLLYSTLHDEDRKNHRISCCMLHKLIESDKRKLSHMQTL